MIPINEAELVIEPFWDKCFMQLKEWNIENAKPYSEIENPSSVYENVLPIEGKGFRIRRLWNGFNYTILAGASLKMSRTYNIDCENYNSLVLECTLPDGAELSLTVKTNKGEFKKIFANSGNPYKEEFSVGFEGNMLCSVEICIFTSKDINGKFSWLMMRDEKFLSELAKRKTPPSEKWTGYIKNEDYNPAYKLKYNMFTTDESIEILRQQIDPCKLLELKETALNFPEPEGFCEKFLNNNKRFTPKQYWENSLLGNAQTIALAGILCKDRKLCEKALRYILTIACCENWVEAFICDARGMMFEHKGFAPSIACSDIAIVMELCGELLEERAVQFLAKRLAEEGLGRINMVVWKYSGEGENIFKMNQLAWFSNGRLPAYSIIEKYMPAAVPYGKLAFEELLGSIDSIILPDGGYEEGIGYFISISHYCGMSVYKYAKAHGLDYKKSLPKKFLNTADYVEALLSLDESMDYIPICDAHACVSATRYATLAAMMPGTHWITLFRRAWEREGCFNTDIFTLLIECDIEKTPPKELRSFINLPHCGVVSSVRKIDNDYIKILVWGAKKGSSHQHLDKGSFVVQYAGETIFADPGIGNYGHNIGGSMWSGKWHSLLMPVVEGEVVEQCKIKESIIPDAKGNDTEFYSKTDVLPAWDGFFNYYTRELISKTPSELVVRDNYSLKKGDKVDFSLITPLNVIVEEDYVTVMGEKTISRITLPLDCTAKVTELPEYEGHRYKRVSIIKNGTEAAVDIKFNFERR